MAGGERLKMANLEVLLSVTATTTDPMPTAPEVIPAHARVREDGETLVVELSGRWRITEPRPDWRSIVGKRAPKAVRIAMTVAGSRSIRKPTNIAARMTSDRTA